MAKRTPPNKARLGAESMLSRIASTFYKLVPEDVQAACGVDRTESIEAQLANVFRAVTKYHRMKAAAPAASEGQKS